jgi:hypothetical protein
MTTTPRPPKQPPETPTPTGPETIALDYTPHPWQARAHADPHRYRAAIAGIRGGKTVWGAIEFLRCVTAAPRGVALLTGPDLPTLKLTALETILRGMGPGRVGRWPERLLIGHNRTDKVLTLATGHRVVYRGAENPDDLRGPAAIAAWIDEATLCKPGTLAIVQGRLLDTGGRLLVTATPKGRGNWFYTQVLNRLPEVEPGRCWADGRWAVYRWKSAENPALAAADVADLGQEYSEAFRRQELDAEWIDLADSPFLPEVLDRSFGLPVPHVGEPRGPSHPCVIGIDPAGQGRDYRTAVVCCLTCYAVVDAWRARRGPFRSFYTAVGTLARRWQPHECVVDATAMGGQMALEELEATITAAAPQAAVRGFTFTQRTKVDLLIGLACRLEDGLAIPADPCCQALRTQLRTYAWDDARLETDDLMALALAAQALPRRSAEASGPAPEAAGLAPRPYEPVRWQELTGL